MCCHRAHKPVQTHKSHKWNENKPSAKADARKTAGVRTCSCYKGPRTTYPREPRPQLKIHDIVCIQLLQALVEIVLEHRGIANQSRSGSKSLFKPLPDDILAGVPSLWVCSEQGEIPHQTGQMPATEGGRERETKVNTNKL